MKYKVKQGDSVASIAKAYGLLPEKIWDHPSNNKLRQVRQDPNMLLEGDHIYIPKKDQRFEVGQTETRHLFRRKGVPAKIRFRLVDEEDKPRNGLNYVINIDGQLYRGTTDNNGALEYSIPPDAKKAFLNIDGDTYDLPIGFMDPIDTISGIQAGLKNLGFDCGKVDGNLGLKTKATLMEFQRKHDLDMTGEPDDGTKQKLEELHES